jgi:hypothetical protein
MKRALIALTLTIAVIGLLAAETHASGPLRKWKANGRPSRQHQTRAHYHSPLHGLGYSRYQSVEEAYPRYIGAFHSRYFNDLGVAPGDVGIRTNGITLSPW